LQVFVRLF